MNYASEWRLALAQKIASRYAVDPNVCAVTVAGSVARSWADEWSDIEIELFCERAPTDAERRGVISELGGNLVEYLPFQPEEWEESYELSGVRLEVNHYLVSTIEQFVADVTERADPDEYKQLRVAGIQYCLPLHGNELIRGWQARICRYPDELARRIIRANIGFGGWNGVEMLLARGDLVLAYDLMVKTQKQLLIVLLALNRIYMAHPRGKWLANVAAEMRYKPERLAERITFALRAGSVEGAREMDNVVRETFGLVEQHFPDIDTTEARRDAFYRRARKQMEPKNEID